MIAVGIDIASKKHDYFMIQSETGLTFKRSSVTIENNESGYKKLHEDIQAFSVLSGTLAPCTSGISVPSISKNIIFFTDFTSVLLCAQRLYALFPVLKIILPFYRIVSQAEQPHLRLASLQ